MIYGLHYKIKEVIKMKDTAIIYEWIENGKEHQKEISREDFYAMFDGLAKGFEKLGDN